MSLLKQLWQNNLLKVFFITFVILIISLMGLILSHLAGVLTPNNFSGYISVINNFIAIIASLIALSIPFMMKDIESKKKKVLEKEEIRLIIIRLFEYLTLPLELPEKVLAIAKIKPEFLIKKGIEAEPRLPSFQMPYFLSLAKNKPELLIKMGIEVESKVDQDSGMTFSTLHILDKYRLYMSPGGLKIEQVDSINQYREVDYDEGTPIEIIDKIVSKVFESGISMKLKDLVYYFPDLWEGGGKKIGRRR